MPALRCSIVAFLSVLSGSALADCNLAVTNYNSAISDINTGIRRYTSCLSVSNGQDDCSSEFRRIRSAQSDFESAVSEYAGYCKH